MGGGRNVSRIFAKASSLEKRNDKLKSFIFLTFQRFWKITCGKKEKRYFIVIIIVIIIAFFFYRTSFERITTTTAAAAVCRIVCLFFLMSRRVVVSKSFDHFRFICFIWRRLESHVKKEVKTFERGEDEGYQKRVTRPPANNSNNNKTRTKKKVEN